MKQPSTLKRIITSLSTVPVMHCLQHNYRNNAQQFPRITQSATLGLRRSEDD